MDERSAKGHGRQRRSQVRGLPSALALALEQLDVMRAHMAKDRPIDLEFLRLHADLLRNLLQNAQGEWVEDLAMDTVAQAEGALRTA